MISKKEIVQMLVGLYEVNDLSLVTDGGSILTFQVCDFDDRELVIEIAKKIGGFLVVYDYFESPNFIRSIEGKSEAYKRMLMKSYKGTKKEKLLKRVGEALVHAVSDDIISDLFSASNIKDLKKISEVVLTLKN